MPLCMRVRRPHWLVPAYRRGTDRFFDCFGLCVLFTLSAEDNSSPLMSRRQIIAISW
jgi:hypothetical protein